MEHSEESLNKVVDEKMNIHVTNALKYDIAQQACARIRHNEKFWR